MQKLESKENFVLKMNEQYQAMFISSNIRSRILVALRMLSWVGDEKEATRSILLSIISVIRNTLDGKGSEIHDVDVFARYFANSVIKPPFVIISGDGVLRLSRAFQETNILQFQTFSFIINKENTVMFLDALQEFTSKD